MEIPPAPRKVKPYYIKKVLRWKMPNTYILSFLLNIVSFFAVLSIATIIFMEEDYMVLLIPGILFVILLPFRLFIKSQYPKYKALLENGVHVKGRIVGIGKKANPFRKIVYCYEEKGVQKEVSIQVNEGDDYSTFKLGEEVNVLALKLGLNCIVTKEFLRYIDK